MTNKFLAFTLAETLIVMGVIGIVSALTLPNLNSSTGDKEKVAKVKKIYQNLNDAYGRAEAVYGPISEWYVAADSTDALKSKRVGERFTEFIKLSKTCGTGAVAGCFTSSTVKSLSGASAASQGFDGNGDNLYKVITADGTAISFNTNSAIIVDIDGATSGSGTIGRDLFRFDIDSANATIVPYRHSATTFEQLVSNSYYGYASTAWIIDYDNADYLKFNATTGTCKNGGTVSSTNPRCK